MSAVGASYVLFTIKQHNKFQLIPEKPFDNCHGRETQWRQKQLLEFACFSPLFREPHADPATRYS